MTNYNAQRFATEVEIITTKLVETLKSKNADYGNNVDKNIDEWGLSSLAIRLDDKLSRFKNLIKENKARQVSDEAIEDTLLDLAGYAILGYRKMQEMNHKVIDKIDKEVATAIEKALKEDTTQDKRTLGSTTFTFNC
ncbi:MULTISPECIES: nucleotide modification associated domain-containing protein [unclassified Lysinibacillus]|uniref:nucleotide modification associated domain-containing protein n=1 Tax=unclassified Lysinibacillus TaxID=2636778 RepID=UPI00381F4A39